MATTGQRLILRSGPIGRLAICSVSLKAALVASRRSKERRSTKLSLLLGASSAFTVSWLRAVSAERGPEAVTADDDLYRTVFHTFVKDGRVSPSALATNNQRDPISVSIARLAPPPDQHPKRLEKPHLGVALLPARVPIDTLGLDVIHLPEQGDYSHAHILNPGDARKQRENCRRMAEAMRLLVPPSVPLDSSR